MEDRMVKTTDAFHGKVMSNGVNSQTKRWWMSVG